MFTDQRKGYVTQTKQELESGVNLNGLYLSAAKIAGSFNATTNNTQGVVVGAGGGSVAAGARHARTDFLGGEGTLSLESTKTGEVVAKTTNERRIIVIIMIGEKKTPTEDEFKSKAPRLQKKEAAALPHPEHEPYATAARVPNGCTAYALSALGSYAAGKFECAVGLIPRASVTAVAVHRAIRRCLGVVGKVDTSDGRRELHRRPARRLGVLFVKPVKYVEGEKGDGLESNEQKKTHPAGKHTNPLAISVGLALPAEHRAPHGEYDHYTPAAAKSAYRTCAAHARAHAPACSVGVVELKDEAQASVMSHASDVGRVTQPRPGGRSGLRPASTASRTRHSSTSPAARTRSPCPSPALSRLVDGRAGGRDGTGESRIVDAEAGRKRAGEWGMGRRTEEAARAADTAEARGDGGSGWRPQDGGGEGRLRAEMQCGDGGRGAPGIGSRKGGSGGPCAVEAGGRGRRAGVVREAAGACVKRRDGEVGVGSWVGARCSRDGPGWGAGAAQQCGGGCQVGAVDAELGTQRGAQRGGQSRDEKGGVAGAGRVRCWVALGCGRPYSALSVPSEVPGVPTWGAAVGGLMILDFDTANLQYRFWGRTLRQSRAIRLLMVFNHLFLISRSDAPPFSRITLITKTPYQRTHSICDLNLWRRRDRRNQPAESLKGNANALNISPAECARLIKYREHHGWSAEWLAPVIIIETACANEGSMNESAGDEEKKGTYLPKLTRRQSALRADNQSTDGGASIEANMIECAKLAKVRLTFSAWT
ncbi:hypothetical protein C8F04DRAFT_1195118 [Mycena alexandri]|uniref:Uncharacterized protein n=1 Tax=Mycena alexandri TaxID=1745969 RepID=A0AAD6WP45_9AGAR|nr:hypothetical protein C8F04DRAFT_1196822 [Mycena alexandri]KAJ7021803.1 hypothetical protein C8F04DRAFT_1195118 [Mycena alexandri]